METAIAHEPDMDRRIAERLKSLRAERGWSLDELARRSTVSRATLSRLENAEVSPTAQVLGRLCAAFGLPLSRLMLMVEQDFDAVVRRDAQPIWRDPENGFVRRSVSPPSRELTGEVIECQLAAGVRIHYPVPPRHGLEHHLCLLEGELRVSVSGHPHDLRPGDCLRYRLSGESLFETPSETGARYLLFIL
ncbi:helix-turn-helix transcriptional regulator [Stappia sp. F7233]|uniref:Helix-turn-helix transcriptional regulator n=1 Tax=Stappia albiluteola TaxID=2758565 RepID=A0A839AG71_9HYPH|nr:XRE family transcriptional regulator [Stappia albiluteola]MBA5777767.1 helix-turn-helix transcriptional regulator [Stappia albiluteola]